MLTYNLGIYDEEKQIYYLRKSIQDIKKYIEKIKENTNSKNAYKLKKVFYNKIEKTSRGLINNSNIRLNLMKIDVLE